MPAAFAQWGLLKGFFPSPLCASFAELRGPSFSRQPFTRLLRRVLSCHP